MRAAPSATQTSASTRCGSLSLAMLCPVHMLAILHSTFAGCDAHDSCHFGVQSLEISWSDGTHFVLSHHPGPASKLWNAVCWPAHFLTAWCAVCRRLRRRCSSRVALARSFASLTSPPAPPRQLARPPLRAPHKALPMALLTMTMTSTARAFQQAEELHAVGNLHVPELGELSSWALQP